MKFQKRLEAEGPSIFIDGESSCSAIKYKILKKHISNSTLSFDFHLAPRLPVDGECSICIEKFGDSSSLISTSCGHRFHPYCLIAALDSGFCASCPLCRRSAGELVPDGPDGDCLRFLAMTHVNARAVQRCHDRVMNSLEKDFTSLQNKANQDLSGDAALYLVSEITVLASKLDRTVRSAALNYEGFRKILKKFDKRTGRSISSAMLPRLQTSGFFVDVTSQNGRCASLRHRLTSLLRGHTPPNGQPASEICVLSP